MVIAIAVISLLGVLVCAACLVYLHIAPTGLNPVRDAVSQYGITDYFTFYRAAALALGVASLTLAVALLEALSEANAAGIVFLVILGFARLTIGWVPMDAPGAPRTSTGLRHNLLATAFFASATVAAFLFTGTFAADPALSGIAPASGVLAWAMAVFSALILLTSVVGPLKTFFGLAERLLYVAVLAWVATVAIALISS
ncbi:DUF998 domain-containing protein [Agreia sp. PsM10]|uniref:DUF998 domain-containing protein n=1 Tax=Agreia sp. PsM10 TaxID=3030533 RepID=UPI00263BB198|nr:DUF998 domain-containing protein [Agreia sp. PsM10]MDN4642301.1 DUF998 domain-containing protein [Agreia sp. PsM10]